MTRATSIAVHRSLAAVDLPAWDALFERRSFYTSSPWLRHAHATAEPAPYYFVGTRHGETAAALAAYPLDGASPYVFCRPDFVVGAVARDALGRPAPWAAELLPALVCGGRNPSHAKLGSRAALGSERPGALRDLLERAEEEAAGAGLRSIGFLYVDEDDALVREALAGAAYTAFDCDVAYSLAVPPSFDDYLARFDQPHRVKLKRDLRALDEAGVEYRVEPLGEALIERIVPLEAALYAKHGTPGSAASLGAVLRSIARNAGDAARVVTAYLGQRLCGFVLVFAFRGEWYARQAGFDYAAKGKLPLYFGLVYYQLLRLALAAGDVSEIHYSIGSGQAKTSRGCFGRKQIAYVKSFDPATRAQLAGFAALVRESGVPR